MRALTPDETRTWADIATDDEHYCEHVKDFHRAWIGAAAVAYGEHLAAVAGPIDEREAAYRASVDELTTAWKEKNPEFGNALHMAVVMGRTRPLKEYLASDKLLSHQNRRNLAAFIGLLEKRIASTQKKKRGRRQRNPEAAKKAERAERNAAWLVAFCKAAWRKGQGRQRVPAAEENKMIDRAIKEAAREFGVPAGQIKKDNIRSALKSGRIVVL